MRQAMVFAVCVILKAFFIDFAVNNACHQRFCHQRFCHQHNFLFRSPRFLAFSSRTAMHQTSNHKEIEFIN